MTAEQPSRVWFDRSFELGLPTIAFPDILERLRGTPLRLEERMRAVGAKATARPSVSDGDSWSAQEHAGHLADLEHLWLRRLDDLSAGRDRLRDADLENRATWDADYNAKRAEDILADFRNLRAEMVARLEVLTESELAATALHPRLEQPMSAVDLCFFVAEHDDHHLSAITSRATEGKEADTVDARRVADLAQLFREAGAAHHQAFLETDGADPDWPIWYAQHLFPTLAPLLGEVTESEIVGWLLAWERTHQAIAPDRPWPEFYAQRLARLEAAASQHGP